MNNRPLSAKSCQSVLESNILPFWIDRMRDDLNGGFYGRIDGKDSIHDHTDKGVILNTRILWTFSIAYYEENNKPEYKQSADRAYKYLVDHFIDKDKGGVFWSVDYQGQIADSKKQIYALAFAIYALSEYYKITEKEEVLEHCKELFLLIEKHSLDKEYGGYLEAFNRDWVLLDDLRLSDKDQNEAKTMNTHLHILEAYTNLYMVWKDDALEKSLSSLIRLFLDRFVKDDGHFHLFFDEKWNLKSDEVSYGHDIEGGWLLHEAAVVLGDHGLINKTEVAAVNMTNAALRGLDTDGGLMYHGNDTGAIDRDKHWWPQAEALVGLVNAYQITEDDKYLDHAREVWNFIQKHLIDEQKGEWYWSIRADGSINKDDDKAGPWKCPYHNGRAMIELVRRLKD